MKKISVLLALTIFLTGSTIMPCHAGIISTQKAKIEKNKIYKSTYNDIKNVIEKQIQCINKYDLDALSNLYSNDFVNSDGFDKEIYFKLIKETWETYPDITYKTEIKNIDFTDNYATVYTHEVAYATSDENIEGFMVIGELYSTAKCVYYLEKHGNNWLINSEKIVEETSVLKYGKARYIKIELNTPKQVGSGKFYTSTLKVDAPNDTVVVASINKENIVYPQTRSDDTFRKMPDDNTLERVFKANTDNTNEYNTASICLTQVIKDKNNNIRMDMGNLAFIITRVNVIPENKFIEKAKGEK